MEMESTRSKNWTVVAVIVGLVAAVVVLAVGLRASGIYGPATPLYGSIAPVSGGLSAAAQSVSPVASPSTQDDVAVSIVDFAFQPDSTEIAAGTTVTWTNTGSAPHTVTADDGSFDSGRLSPGDTFTHTFTTPGTVTYHCNVHPFMTATIVVN